MIWHCDTSALVKRQVHEIGSAWVRHEVDRHTIVIAHITVVEVHAALAARYRLGTLPTFSCWDRRWRVGPNARITSRFIAGRAARGPTRE